MSRCEKALIAATLFSVSLSPIRPASSESAQESTPSSIITLSVLVTDRAGQPITNLTRQAFRIFEGNKEQSISDFSVEPMPLRYALVVDNTGSMRQFGSWPRDAANALIANHKQGDIGILLSLRDREASLATSWTSDANLLARELANLKEPLRSAGIADGLLKAGELLAAVRAPDYRRAIILISDGYDPDSATTTDKLVKFLNKENLQVFAIGLVPAEDERNALFRVSPRQQALKLLDAVTRETGGRAFLLKTPQEVRDMPVKIMNCLRSEYVLGYQPTKPLDANSFREITVKVKSGSDKYLITARKHIGIPSS